MPYRDIEASAVEALLEKDNVIVIDMRDAQSQSLGMLPKAVPASDDVINGIVRQRRKNPPVLVYCYEGNMSRDLCTFIAQLGLIEVYNLAGGWKAWATRP
ncbi:MAG: rhodanese-like domain-containing protein [Magnetospiraceae bacterium]